MSQQNNDDFEFDAEWNELAESIKQHRKNNHHSNHKHTRHQHKHSNRRHSSHSHSHHSHSTSSRSGLSHHSEQPDMATIEANLKTMNKSLQISSTENEKAVIEQNIKQKRKLPLFLKIIIGIVIFLIIVAIALLSTFLILRNIGEKELFTYENLKIETIEESSTTNNGETVVYNGKTYDFNPNVTSILFLGVDRRNLGTDDDIVGTGGQADAIFLLTYDRVSGVSKVLSFSRDTIVDVNTYATNGDYAGIENTQLCLAYAYGDGKELSATNMVTSVQRLIYNIPINSYFAMDLDSIKIITDDIGGVTLTPLETIGDTIIKGQQITLDGSKSELYIRYRDTEKLDSNAGRIERQKHYLTEVANQLVPAIKKDLGLPVSLYNDVKDYTVTNLNASRITYLASNISQTYKGLDFIPIPGEIVESKQDGKAEFIPDRIKLYEILLDTFYTVRTENADLQSK